MEQENKNKPIESVIFFKKEKGGTYSYKVHESDNKTLSLLMKELGLKEDSNLNEKVSNKIRIINYIEDAICTGQPQHREDVNCFSQREWIWENGEDIKNWDIIPCIHITKTNVFINSLYGDEPLKESVPRSYQIMDNSIWNYLVPKIDELIPDIDKEGKKTSIGFKEIFHKALESICRNYEKNLYSLSVAKEFVDLNARLAKEAFVAGSHAEGVSPFIFHSESSIQRMIKKEFIGEDKVIQKIANQKWRILLVDDKAKKSMSNDKNNNEDYSWSCKLVIIINLFKRFLDIYAKGKTIACQEYKEGKNNLLIFDEENLRLIESPKEDIDNPDIFIMFEYAQNVEDAEKALKARTYDLILLDYYLENDKTYNHSYGTNLLESVYTYVTTKKSIESFLALRPEKKKEDINRIFDTTDIKYEEFRKYVNKEGHEDIKNLYNVRDTKLIEKVCEQIKNEEKLGAGPNDRQFFMFISAYSSAVYERLLAEGLNQSEKFWFINVGACPTNTPQLFLYNLIKLMDKRLEDSGILKFSSDEIYKLINTIYLPKDEDPKGDSVRKKANSLYQRVLSLQYHYRNILKDVEIPFGQNASVFDTKGSVLMTDFIQKKINLGGMLEHLTQLVHLTAFGTIRQWLEMWEEYIYFKALFEKQLDDVSEKDFRDLCGNIEEYILKLKSQQQ